MVLGFRRWEWDRENNVGFINIEMVIEVKGVDKIMMGIGIVRREGCEGLSFEYYKYLRYRCRKRLFKRGWNVVIVILWD